MADDICELCKSGTPAQVSEAIHAGGSLKARNEHGRTPLMCAAGNNDNAEVVALLLAAGSPVNDASASGKTALMLAAGYNANPAVLMILLEAGADAGAKDAEGKSVLDFAGGNAKLIGSSAYDALKRALV